MCIVASLGDDVVTLSRNILKTSGRKTRLWAAIDNVSSFSFEMKLPNYVRNGQWQVKDLAQQKSMHHDPARSSHLSQLNPFFNKFKDIPTEFITI